MRLRKVCALLLPGLLAACGDDSPETAGDVSSDAADDTVGSGDGGTDAGADGSGFDAAAAIEALAADETWTLPGLDGAVSVIRTEAGVPHIYASTSHDAQLVAGFVLARDRYVQFELGRRVALGEASGLLGAIGVPIDMGRRLRGSRAVVDRVVANLSPRDLAMFEAFAEGINAYIAAVRDGRLPLPPELEIAARLGGIENPLDLMQELTAADAAGFTGTAIYSLGYDELDVMRSAYVAELATLYDDETADAELRRAGLRPDVLDAVTPLIERSSGRVFVDEKHGEIGQIGAPRALPRVERGLLERAAAASVANDRLLGRGSQRDFGSNGWAIAGSVTQDGSSWLAGDGHLSLGVPTIFYQMGMDTAVYGDGEITTFGLHFAGLPTLAVGTNGRVAWTQTYLYADVTDWYAEQVTLGDDGLPASTLFDGELRATSRIDETLSVLAGGEYVDRTEPRWTTFDGRQIVDYEGDAVDEGGVATLSGRVVPRDVDDDGVITALSFDFTGFDVADTVGTAADFSRSSDVDEFRAATRGLVAYAQNLLVADSGGRVMYTSYNGMPCRGYLGRDAEGRWAEGADPGLLLDGTTYGGFTIPLTAELEVDESQGADPYRCVIGFDEWPTVVDPTSGFVVSSNNDVAGLAYDGRLDNDPIYIGGPWDLGFRADTIHRRIEESIAAGDVNTASIAATQADHTSPLASIFVPSLVAAVEHARAAASPTADPTEAELRLVAAYTAEREAIDEAIARIEAWVDGGADAASGVDTFYDAPTDADRTNAVATMIYNTWFRQFARGVLDDEGFVGAFELDPRGMPIRLLVRMVEGRGAGNSAGLVSYETARQESVYFDELGTEVIETSDEVIVAALARAVSALAARSSVIGVGGFGTTDQAQWLWGLRHQVEFPSLLEEYGGAAIGALLGGDFSISPADLPLADGLTVGDPRFGLKGFPRPGDIYAVDAANPAIFGTDFRYSTGPVMRMIIGFVDGRVVGQNVIPGGQSGDPNSPHFVDQTGDWLGNTAIPFRFSVEDVISGAVSREVYTP